MSWNNNKTRKSHSINGLSLGEILITLGIIGVLVTILMPVLSKSKPNENELLRKKTAFILERVVNEIGTDEFLYPRNGDYTGFGNTSPVTVDGVVHSGATKFCTLFASRINKAANTTVNCTNGQKSVTSVEGIDWYLPISNFQNDGFETIRVDVNGKKPPNAPGRDQFTFQVRSGIKIPVKEIGVMDATAPPAARPIMPDEPAGNTTDPRTGQNWYCIRCNPTTNGSVYGYGCNKPNGHYQLVAIPKIGYKGSWFTKSVTVNNADVPASECNVTFTPIVDIPTPDGPTPPPTPTPTPDPTPEKTYCINVTKTGGDVTQCAVAGDGCNKKPGTYVVSASGKGDYKTSWSTKDVTIENKDVNLTLVCDKDPEPDPCYSITTTGDTTNCPVTLPAGTCKTDKTKYTSGTYSYTVTPKAGFSFNGSVEESSKQIIVDSDKEINIVCPAKDLANYNVVVYDVDDSGLVPNMNGPGPFFNATYKNPDGTIGNFIGRDGSKATIKEGGYAYVQASETTTVGTNTCKLKGVYYGSQILDRANSGTASPKYELKMLSLGSYDVVLNVHWNCGNKEGVKCPGNIYYAPLNLCIQKSDATFDFYNPSNAPCYPYKCKDFTPSPGNWTEPDGCTNSCNGVTNLWDSYRKACVALGRGWRLPSYEELLDLTVDSVTGMTSGTYWSSTWEDESSFSVNTSGESNRMMVVSHGMTPMPYHKTASAKARCVKNFDASTDYGD